MSHGYELLFRRVLYPAYEAGLARRHTLRHLRGYERDQWLAPEQVRALQWSRLKHLIDHCWKNVPFYRRRWQQVGATPADIRTLEDYARLPPLTKRDIRENFSSLQARNQREPLLYKATGGSTGEPLRFGYTRESYERRTAVMWRGYGWTGARPGRRTLLLWAGTVGNPGWVDVLKDRAYHAAFQRRMLDSFGMRDDNLSRYADEIEAFAPEIIVGYVGPLVRLAQWMADNGRTIAGVQSVLGAAEALHDFQRPILEAAFPGATAYNTYGCREVMLIASECEHRDGLHINADHLVVETLPGPAAHTHGKGELVVTDLSNYGMPLMRYLNGDLVTPGPDTPCACGRGLPRLSRVDGRKLDAIRTTDGRLLPGEFFPHMLKDVAGVRRFQVLQERIDRLRIDIVPGPEFGGAQEGYIRGELARTLGSGVDIQLRRVDAIPLTPAGKFRVTVSMLEEQHPAGPRGEGSDRVRSGDMEEAGR